MSEALLAAIAVAIVGMVALIIWAGAVHARRNCDVPDCLICRVTGRGDAR